MDDFKDYPKSIGELRDDPNAALWTPREALINVLRAIDSGEVKPDTLVICYRETRGKGITDCYFSQSGPDIETSLGLLARVSARLSRPAR